MSVRTNGTGIEKRSSSVKTKYFVDFQIDFILVFLIYSGRFC